MRLTFLGAAGTVTGSKYLLEGAGRRVLVDCGLFQGWKALRLLNRTPDPFDPAALDAVVLSHAHLDHSGQLPLLVRAGYRGRILASPATCDLARLLLLDSARLQERDAEYANRHGFSKHRPALPLYGVADAEAALKRFQRLALGRAHAVARGWRATLLPAGHLPGAGSVLIEAGGRSVLFSGDLGRADDPLHCAPEPPPAADAVVIESTYGDRKHDRSDPEAALAAVVRRAATRGGSVLIPAFAVGRAQRLLYHLHRLRRARRIPDLAIYLDSPMAIEAGRVFCAHVDAPGLTAAACNEFCAVAEPIATVEQSKALNAQPYPKIIVSASGMATGGRVLHHLRHMAPDARHIILFSGFQAGGTRGAQLVAGARQIKMHGQWVPVNAEVTNLTQLSSHADQDGLLAWLGALPQPPKHLFITHGEPDAADALRLKIAETFGWQATVPARGDVAQL
jgi:metallo-beta-lactamase family protein